MTTRDIAIVFGGRTFTVQQLAIRADAEWRKTARPIVEPISELTMAAGIANPTPEKVARLVFTSQLLVDPLAVLNAVLAYSPALDEQREWIEQHAYPDEALTALLALFFGMAPQPKMVANGAAPTPAPTTSTS